MGIYSVLPSAFLGRCLTSPDFLGLQLQDVNSTTTHDYWTPRHQKVKMWSSPSGAHLKFGWCPERNKGSLIQSSFTHLKNPVGLPHKPRLSRITTSSKIIAIMRADPSGTWIDSLSEGWRWVLAHIKSNQMQIHQDSSNDNRHYLLSTWPPLTTTELQRPV